MIGGPPSAPFHPLPVPDSSSTRIGRNASNIDLLLWATCGYEIGHLHTSRAIDFSNLPTAAAALRNSIQLDPSADARHDAEDDIALGDDRPSEDELRTSLGHAPKTTDNSSPQKDNDFVHNRLEGMLSSATSRGYTDKDGNQHDVTQIDDGSLIITIDTNEGTGFKKVEKVTDGPNGLEYEATIEAPPIDIDLDDDGGSVLDAVSDIVSDIVSWFTGDDKKDDDTTDDDMPDGSADNPDSGSSAGIPDPDQQFVLPDWVPHLDGYREQAKLSPDDGYTDPADGGGEAINWRSGVTGEVIDIKDQLLGGDTGYGLDSNAGHGLHTDPQAGGDVDPGLDADVAVQTSGPEERDTQHEIKHESPGSADSNPSAGKSGGDVHYAVVDIDVHADLEVLHGGTNADLPSYFDWHQG